MEVGSLVLAAGLDSEGLGQQMFQVLSCILGFSSVQWGVTRCLSLLLLPPHGAGLGAPASHLQTGQLSLGLALLVPHQRSVPMGQQRDPSHSLFHLAPAAGSVLHVWGKPRSPLHSLWGAAHFRPHCWLCFPWAGTALASLLPLPGAAPPMSISAQPSSPSSAGRSCSTGPRSTRRSVTGSSVRTGAEAVVPVCPGEERNKQKLLSWSQSLEPLTGWAWGRGAGPPQEGAEAALCITETRLLQVTLIGNTGRRDRMVARAFLLTLGSPGLDPQHPVWSHTPCEESEHHQVWPQANTKQPETQSGTIEHGCCSVLKTAWARRVCSCLG